MDLFVPGRLCLFGEHTDWVSEYKSINNSIISGQAICSLTKEKIEAAVTKDNDFIFEFLNQKIICKMEEKELQRQIIDNPFFSYVLNTTSYILKNYEVGGIRIKITNMNLPIGKGLSSSAAICCLVAKSFNQLYDLKLSKNGEMEIAYIGEKNGQSKCGKTDQICTYQNGTYHINFEDGSIAELKSTPIDIVIGVFSKKKNTRQILQILHSQYPYITDLKSQKVHEAFGIDNLIIIKDALKLIKENDKYNLGKLMNNAQAIYNEKVASLDDVLKEEKINYLKKDQNILKHIYGAKGIGSHGDQAIQFLPKDYEHQKKLIKQLNDRKIKTYCLTIK